MAITYLDEAPSNKITYLDEAPKIKEGKSVWSAVGANVTPQMQIEHPILSGIAQAGQDLATVPGNFFNQLLFNAPRAALNKAGYDYPKAQDNNVEKSANIAGLLGGLKNPLNIKNPLVAGAAYGALYSNKDNIGLDQKSLLNRLTGAGVGVAGGAVLSGLGKVFNSGDVINKFIGSRKKDFLFGRNPGQAVVDEGIIAGNPDELTSKIQGKLSEYGQKINDMVKTAAGTINANDIVGKFDKAMNGAAINNDQGLVNRLAEIKTAITNKLAIDPSTGSIQSQYLRDLTKLSPLEATEIKRIIGEKAKFTGNPSDDKLVNNVLRDAYGTIRRKIETVVPEVAPLNQRYADLKTATIAISRKDFTKTPLIGVLGGGARGILGGLVASGGNPVGAGIGAIAEPLLERAINNTRAKTIQAMIYKAGETAKQKVAANNQELLGIQNILNQSNNQNN